MILRNVACLNDRCIDSGFHHIYHGGAAVLSHGNGADKRMQMQNAVRSFSLPLMHVQNECILLSLERFAVAEILLHMCSR